MKKIIIFLLILGVILGIVGFWYWNKNSYSKDILKLEILGPEPAKISLSDDIEYIVKYKNTGSVKLEDTHLIFEFPENTTSISMPGVEMDNLGQRIEINSDKLGDIYPGEEKILRFKGKILGKEGEVKTAKVWLSYRPKNLKARYESTSSYSVTISSVPITLDFDLSSKIEPEKEFSLTVNYFSNLDYPLTNIGLKMEYPTGFEFISSRPKSLDNIEWDIPILNKAEGGRIKITGKLSGEIKEQKIFKAVLGVWLENEFVPLKETIRGVEITTPYIDILQEVNNQKNYTANAGDLLHYEIYFRNIGDEPFKDLFLIVKLNGEAFDFDTLKADRGQFTKGDNSIIWDWRDIPKLQFLDQGEEGKVEFWIKVKDDWKISSQQETNPVLNDVVLISQARKEFQIKLNSKLEFSQKGYYQDEIFNSSGPLSAGSGHDETYTIFWEVKNYYNDMTNVKVKAVLPENVELTGNILPEKESSNFSFDSKSREIVWSVEDSGILKAGTGILTPALNIAFQISLPAGSKQEELIGKAVISGEDLWTGQKVERSVEALTKSSLNK